jgi:hypothetical protein
MQGWATKEDMMTSTQVFVGIDVSNKQLDLASDRRDGSPPPTMKPGLLR